MQCRGVMPCRVSARFALVTALVLVPLASGCASSGSDLDLSFAGTDACGFTSVALPGTRTRSRDELNDFLAHHVFPKVQGECTLGKIMGVLHDPNGVAGDDGKTYRCSSETAIVSESAQVVGRELGAKQVGPANSSYRFVIRTSCLADGDERDSSTGLAKGSSPPEFGIMFSPLEGVQVTANAGSPTERQACLQEISGKQGTTTAADFNPNQLTSCSDDTFKALCAGTATSSLGALPARAAGNPFCFGPGFDEKILKPCWPENESGLADQDFDNDINSNLSQTRCFHVEGNFDDATSEIIAFESTNRQGSSRGVFNYYEASAGRGLRFFGSSDDFDRLYSPDTTIAGMRGHASSVFGGGNGKCGACHGGGGLVMKELASPWVNWEHFTSTPGAGSIRASFRSIMGESDFFDGAALETVVDQGNAEIRRHKIARLRADGNLKALLRPMFCPTEINLGSAGGPQGGGDGPGLDGPGADVAQLFLPSDLFVDSALLQGFGQSSLAVPLDAYQRARSQLGQKVFMFTGNVVSDTFFELTFVQRSRMDSAFVGVSDLSPIDDPSFESFGPPSSLVGLGLIRPSLARKIAAIDMTRPIFSDARCGLIARLPESGTSFLAGDGIVKTGAVADAVEQKIKDALAGDSSPAATALRAMLDDKPLDARFLKEGGARKVQEANLILASVQFSEKCALRAILDQKNDATSFVGDVLTVAHDVSNNLQGAGGEVLQSSNHFPIIEIPGVQLATSTVTTKGTQYLDPNTCALENDGKLTQPDVSFCRSPAVPGGANARRGGWCFDGLVDVSGNAVWPDGVVERPAGQTWVNCKDAGVTGIDTDCFGGCRRMRNGLDDECQPKVQPDFTTCDQSQHTQFSAIESFCDDPTTTASKDRFDCGQFGSATRLWCKGACKGDFVDSTGQLHDTNGDRVIRATCE